jgi:phage-related protein|nr:MAG TPA: minor tail protein [Caudoviricetes sp.]
MTKIIKQTQEQLANVDMSKLQKAVKQQMPLFKKQIQNLKKSIENNDISIKIDNKDAEKQISQTQKQIDSLNEKINARQMKLNVINPQIDKIVDDTRKNVTPEGINPNDKAMDTTVNNALNGNKDFTSLNSQAQKLYTEIELYNKQLDVAKSKMAELKQQTSQTATTQNKLSSLFYALKPALSQITSECKKISNGFLSLVNPLNYIKSIIKGITNKLKGAGGNVKQGLGQILKYAGALFSLRSIYSALSSSANAWLSSQNAQAKQLSANIDYMKYAMGSALSPVIQFVTNCVYQLLKAVQSVVYALFKVNIFANASASAFKNAQKQAKNTSKSLSSVHSEINNVGDHNSDASPNVGDLSSIDNQMSPLSQKLYDFFKPLVDSWNKYGATLIEQIKTTAGQIASLISSVWESVEKLITNGTVYTSLELILAIIGNIAEAFSNAWKYEGNGDTIIQTMADMLNSILNTIRKITASEGFQKFLNGVSNAFSGILTFTKPVLDDFLSLIKPLSEIALSIAGDILNSIGNALKWIGDNEIAVTILESLAIAIGLVVAGIKLYNFVQSGALVATLKHTAALIAQGVAWVAANWPILLIVAAITAVIAIIILCVKHWDEIKETVTNVCNKMKETVSNWVNNVGQFFSDLKINIVNKVTEIRDGIKNKFQEAYNGIRNIFSNIENFFNGIWKNIKNTFTNLGTSIGKAISGAVKTGINGVISLIEKTINTAIRLINGGIKLINLIPGVSVGTINTLNLPRLAKGNVAYDETLAIFGEYSGASNNPEITTPQNIMRDTFEDVLSNYGGNNQPISLNLTVNVSNKKLGQILLDDLRDKTRRTGKDIEALVGG